MWLVCALGFVAAFVALFPALDAAGGPHHAGGAFSPAGAAILPFWSMYGELGDPELADASVVGAEFVLWVYLFVANILLINVLIAMMTELGSWLPGRQEAATGRGGAAARVRGWRVGAADRND